MPPRPHSAVLAALGLACVVIVIALLLAAPAPAHARAAAATRAATPAAPAQARAAAATRAATPAAATARWRWPLRGDLVGAFRVTPRAPFAAGQRRGIDIAARPGTAVRAACAGRVTFAGALPHGGKAVTVRCGALVATYLHLAGVVVRRGVRVSTGAALGTVDAAGHLRLGARRVTGRRAYVDPLSLLGDAPPTAPPPVAAAPRPRRLRPARPWPVPAPIAATARQLPWPAYPALALIATAFPLGALAHGRRRTRSVRAAVATHEGP
jgi:peptidase M23-like protein